MPIYEYCCEECGKDFEVFVRSTAKQGTPSCPECGSTETRKALSSFCCVGASTGSTANAAACSLPAGGT